MSQNLQGPPPEKAPADQRHPWEDLDTDLPEPGQVEAQELGFSGEAEELPQGDAEQDELTEVNTYGGSEVA